jgi:hypothetical protein
MLRIFIVALATFIYGLEGNCQLKKFYTIQNDQSYDSVDFTLKATSGTCFIKPSDYQEPLTIYGNPAFADVNPTFNTEINNGTNRVNLYLEDYNEKGLSQVITYSMFGDEKSEVNFWKVFLSEEKIYKLNLKYGVGDAFVNLSNLSVARMKIESGSANVNVQFDAKKKNQCVMDTFSVNVELGTLVAKNLYLSQAKTVIANVGFGTAILDFSQGIDQKCNVSASVGAGQLKVILPKEGYPAIIYFKNSPLCNISIKEEFEEVADHVFINKSYSADAKNLLEFNIDVALGSIVFEYSE